MPKPPRIKPHARWEVTQLAEKDGSFRFILWCPEPGCGWLCMTTFNLRWRADEEGEIHQSQANERAAKRAYASI